MSMTMWQPMRDILTLREAMDRIFEDAVVRRPAERRSDAYTLALEITEQDDKIVVRAPVPGFEPEQIDISVQADVLSIRGAVSQEATKEEKGYHLREWRSGNFQRVVQLPCSVESEKAEAAYKNGILTVSLPKATQEISRKIEVRRD